MESSSALSPDTTCCSSSRFTPSWRRRPIVPAQNDRWSFLPSSCLSEQITLPQRARRWSGYFGGGGLDANFREQRFELASFQFNSQLGGTRPDAHRIQRLREWKIELETDHLAVLLDLRS